MKQHTLTLLPGRRVIVCRDGDLIAPALASAGIFLRTDCGGKGICGKCRVTLSETSLNRVSHNGDDEKSPHRLACRTRIHGDISLTIPAATLMTATPVTKAPALLPAHYTLAGEDIREDDLGVAVDLGTTTIALYLLSLSNKKLLGSLSVKNPQTTFGADVMARIDAVRRDEEALSTQRTLVVRAIEWGCRELLKQAGTSADQLKSIVAVGNTTMIHILAGVSPAPLGVAPYDPVFTDIRRLAFDARVFTLAPATRWTTLPLLSGFLGCDIISAALAVDLMNAPPGTLLVDIGTNGEIMLKNNDGIYAASCATGPAFEGGALSCGMPAVEGAIDRVTIDRKTGRASFTQIGRPRTGATGICGSGIISAMAELLRTGLVRPDGRFDTRRIKGAIHTDATGNPVYTIAPENKASGFPAVTITQKDIRAMQLAKGALMAGIELLLKHSGTDAPTEILLAGAFGSVLVEDDALVIGMLPAACRGKIRFVGNAAGTGAVLALCDRKKFTAMETIAERTRVFNLADDPAFNELFINALGFP
ncbi:ASKHA domain-containing protein [Desulfoluna spongiiphila]|nr:ASKHA domain-containing protein [Desulfoluna spongiiphila]